MGSIKGQKHNPELEGKYAHINPNDVVFTPEVRVRDYRCPKCKQIHNDDENGYWYNK